MADRKKIVIADAMEKEVVEKLRSLGEVECQPEDLKLALKEADVLIVRSATKVTADLIADAPRLKIVARAGVGLDNVDRMACEGRGIRVINTPGASTAAVAELTIGLLICLLRNVGRAHAKMKTGEWDKKGCTGHEAAGKTLGLVGFGRIGRMVAEKASALGMRVIYNDPKMVAGPYGHYKDIDQLVECADIVSLHATTKNGGPALMDKERIGRMKRGAYLINTARGAMVDEAALADALESGHLAGAALDVYGKEPYEGPLREIDNVILTPHIGAGTYEAQERIGEDLIAQLRQMLGKE
ncbi:MAG: hydroxyacid dehydrogenase [Candidatus Micrarchaeota archaeon]